MKRSPLTRKTPLRVGACSLKRTEIQQVSAGRARANSQRTRVVNGMRVAAAGRCARCGGTGQPVFGHERLSRAQGGSIVAPDCLLCNECNGWCEDHPRVAAWTGWKVSNKWPHDPALGIGEAWDLAGNRVLFATYADTHSLSVAPDSVQL